MKTFLYKLFSFESFVPVAILSAASWYVFYLSGLTLSYNDAMSHLDIARLVVDNQEPGFAQLGGVWLPLNHVLSLLLIWNDWAWHSGFAGSFFSMISYVVSTWAIFHIIMRISAKKYAAVLGSLAFALNLNMLYLQATPLTEPLYVMLFCLSCLTFTYWIIDGERRHIKYLFLLGLLGFLQVLTRYDGWFVVIIEGLIIGWHELILRKKSLTETIGRLFLFATPVSFGIVLWLSWNMLIFGNPFFFVLGPYSAHAQQSAISMGGELVTKGNLFLAFKGYGLAILYNAGSFATTLALCGAVYFLFKKSSSMSSQKKILFLLFLSAPILFNIIALYLGFSVINVPSFQPADSLRGEWFNVRYGILALPFIAIVVGLFASWRKLAAIIVLEVIILQIYTTYITGIPTIIDGTVGSSSYDATPLSTGLKDRIKPGDTVLLSIYSFNPVVFKSGIELRQIIHEGVSKKWQKALAHPEMYAEWVVMANDPGDAVYKNVYLAHTKQFLSNYELSYTANNSSIYHRKIQ